MSRRLGQFALAASLLVLFVAAFLFITGTLVPWSNSCPPHLDVDPADDVPADAEIVAYESLTPAERAAFDDALASDSMISLEDRPWSPSTSYVRKNGTLYFAAVAVC
ncbi:hypothetical protein ACOZ4B_10575 [Haloferax prahovense]|uniref:hypothetical protein n=1 Tax=Haloferax TaxID=2251 RepID=UPI000737BDD0|nr:MULTISPECIES: hypothetical protein [unclassified Haloferax]MCO8267928.1 hypothetical protein [Haloferax sp. AB510]